MSYITPNRGYMKLKRLYNYVRSYFPSRLPVGLTEFNAWADEIIDLTGQIADSESMKFVICTSIMHLPATAASVPKQFFVKTLRKTAANQVGGYIFQEIKASQEKRRLAETEKLQAEATAGRLVPASGQAQV